MAELSFKQITDKLNEEFSGENRKLIFWYDAKGEFAEDVDSLELVNASVYHLLMNHSFQMSRTLNEKHPGGMNT